MMKMSLCVCLQNSDQLIIAADTALTIDQDGQRLRFRQPFQKLVQIDRFLVFMCGNAKAATDVRDIFNQCADKSVESFRASIIKGVTSFKEANPELYMSLDSDSRDLGALLAEWTPNGVIVYTLHVEDEYTVHKYEASSVETIPHAGGNKADEALDYLDLWLHEANKSKSVPQVITDIFERLSGSEIGGMLTLAIVNRNGISFMQPQMIKETVKIPYYEDLLLRNNSLFRGSINLYGSQIATSREGNYPRAEMSSTMNMFGAYRTPDNYIQVYSPDDMFSPVIKFQTPTGEGYVYFDTNTGALTIASNDSDINITTSKRVNVECREGFFVNDVNISS
jgi:hypothetical protein